MKIIGLIAQFLFIICYFPQIYQVYKTKQVKDLSILMWVLVTFAYIGMLIYISQYKDIILILGYAIGLVCVLSILIGILLYRRKNK